MKPIEGTVPGRILNDYNDHVIQDLRISWGVYSVCAGPHFHKQGICSGALLLNYGTGNKVRVIRGSQEQNSLVAVIMWGYWCLLKQWGTNVRYGGG